MSDKKDMSLCSSCRNCIGQLEMPRELDGMKIIHQLIKCEVLRKSGYSQSLNDAIIAPKECSHYTPKEDKAKEA